MPRSASTRPAFSYQSPAGSTKSFNYARADERVSKLPVSLRRKTSLRPDHHVRKPPRRKNVRTLRVQGFEPGRDHQIQSVLSRIGLPQHRHQEFGNRRPALRVLARPRIDKQTAEQAFARKSHDRFAVSFSEP